MHVSDYPIDSIAQSHVNTDDIQCSNNNRVLLCGGYTDIPRDLRVITSKNR